MLVEWYGIPLLSLVLGMFFKFPQRIAESIVAAVVVWDPAEVGLEPIHAGIIFILALNISLMTPPVGACLFVLASVTGERVEAISASLWPFIVAEFVILLLVAYWSDLTLFVPRLLGL